jgi:ABC-type sugar transport system substrate-binding protein
MISKSIRNGLLALAAPLLLAASPAMASKDKPTIGVVVPTLDAQFWNNYIDFMKKGAKELGVDLIVLNADNKPDQARSRLAAARLLGLPDSRKPAVSASWKSPLGSSRCAPVR